MSNTTILETLAITISSNKKRLRRSQFIKKGLHTGWDIGNVSKFSNEQLFVNLLTHCVLILRFISMPFSILQHVSYRNKPFGLQSISYRNQSFDLQCKSNDCFLYEMCYRIKAFAINGTIRRKLANKLQT